MEAEQMFTQAITHGAIEVAKAAVLVISKTETPTATMTMYAQNVNRKAVQF